MKRMFVQICCEALSCDSAVFCCLFVRQCFCTALLQHDVVVLYDGCKVAFYFSCFIVLQHPNIFKLCYVALCMLLCIL